MRLLAAVIATAAASRSTKNDANCKNVGGLRFGQSPPEDRVRMLLAHVARRAEFSSIPRMNVAYFFFM